LPRWLGPTNGRDPRSLEPGHHAGAGLPTTDSVCRVHARGLLLDCSASHILDTTMINSFLMISTAVRAEHAPSRSIGNCMSSVRAPSLKTTSEVAGRLVLAAKEGPERERRHWSASVRAGCDIVDLVVTGVPDGARGCRAAVRVVPWTYGTGQASIVPVPCTYGVGLGAPAVSRKVIVTSAFDICRVGDTVVSGRRKTGPDLSETLPPPYVYSTHIRYLPPESWRVLAPSLEN